MQVHKRLFHLFFSHFVGVLVLVLIGQCSCTLSTVILPSNGAAQSQLTRPIPQLTPSSTLHIVETPIKTLEITEQTFAGTLNMSSNIKPQPSSSYFVSQTSNELSTSIVPTLTSSAFDIHLVEPSPTSHWLPSSSMEMVDLSSREPLPTARAQVESEGVLAPSGQPAQLSHEAMSWMTSAPSSAQHLHGGYSPHSLPAGTVAGIVIASLGFLGVLGAALGFLALRRFRPLHAKTYDSSYCSSGDTFSYLDNLQVSYINHHVQLPKDSVDEMFSLDNDSFLNSLEAMTMENYWAEESKSTKV